MRAYGCSTSRPKAQPISPTQVPFHLPPPLDCHLIYDIYDSSGFLLSCFAEFSGQPNTPKLALSLAVRALARCANETLQAGCC